MTDEIKINLVCSWVHSCKFEDLDKVIDKKRVERSLEMVISFWLRRH